MDGFKDVKWYKIKNIVGQEFSVRGHWEERVALRLNELGIIWTKAKPIPYFDGDITRHYVPDFWLPTLESYVEVKGYQRERDLYKWKSVDNLIIIKSKEISQIRNNEFVLGP